jgi:uncharacterized protein (UPF0147 family)
VTAPSTKTRATTSGSDSETEISWQQWLPVATQPRVETTQQTRAATSLCYLEHECGCLKTDGSVPRHFEIAGAAAAEALQWQTEQSVVSLQSTLCTNSNMNQEPNLSCVSMRNELRGV